MSKSETLKNKEKGLDKSPGSCYNIDTNKGKRR
jgi:hypothetical protein